MRITTCSVPIVERGERKKERRGREKRKKEEEGEYSPPRNIEERGENSRTISVRFHASSVNISENIVAADAREEDLAMCTYTN